MQKRWFERQLWLAREIQKPVIIHSREACEDTLEILEIAAKTGITGVMHCFSYSREVAKRYFGLGFYIGVGGVVTFKNSKKLKEAVCAAPLDKILLETDCPYMAPDSTLIKYVAEEIARLKDISADEVISATEENAKRLFAV